MSRLLKIRNRAPSRNQLSKLSSFDQESGLGFVETVHHGGPMRADWVWWSPGGVEHILDYHHPDLGAASLKSMAIRSVSANASSLTPEVMETVPWVVARDVWKELKLNDLDNLHVWKAFALAYSHESEAEILMLRKQTITRMDMYLADYLGPITAHSFEWITFLSLTNITCSRSELINISGLANIGVLTIGHGVQVPDLGIDDSILRSWARASAETNSFSKLRVLACRKQRELTTRAFEYISSIGTLPLLILQECSIGARDQHLASSIGWKHISGDALSTVLTDKNGAMNSWDSIVKALYVQGGKKGLGYIATRDSDASCPLPILNMSLGGESKPAIGKAENICLSCFQKSKQSTLDEPNALRQPSHPASYSESSQGEKRSLQQAQDIGSRKKRLVKPSKQTQVEQAFTEFGF